ncbi:MULTISPECIES: hypothetical protein [Burkholderia]|jgi:hypothetical protein|uniref:Uncharacterized protein n=1 Tax=Burkholderia contaminans TaxID=488447 RepID=A0AAP4VJ12_9BURK|nr:MULTISPECIES: hypothetical protein [Burkholderia]MBD1411090.1 hypothetical protein [Burkholderia contaminans]MBH9666432.1 hypothetical protein [Burkholderia contaminans]MBH9674018.1 hypothetical protein [Burkholderia contaminans]MBH9688104.1 hypothetical protein [Burkholderia contaminans]MBH9704064.1 hypothetical protein [Burkholderia contaminans]
MKSTLIDELVNFKEGFSLRLIGISRGVNRGTDGRGAASVGRRQAAFE